MYIFVVSSGLNLYRLFLLFFWYIDESVTVFIML